MYKEFYGLKEDPFSISPDPDFMYWSQKHLAAFRHLMYSIHRKKGLILLTGEIGAGKTTLVNALCKEIRDKARIASIANSEIDVHGLFQFIFHAFGLPLEDNNKVKNLIRLNEFLLKSRDENQDIVIILDEAHNFSNEVLEEIRLLSNIETPKEKLIQIVLVGQPVLLDRINGIGFEQVKQRVGMSYYLRSLSKVETNFYIKKRLEISGAGAQNIFTDDAIDEVFNYAKGIPRVINTICDNALLFGAAEKSRQIDAHIIRRVVESLYLHRPAGSTHATSMPLYDGDEEEMEDMEASSGMRGNEDVSPYTRIAHLQETQATDGQPLVTLRERSTRQRLTLFLTAAGLAVLILAGLMLAKVDVIRQPLSSLTHALGSFSQEAPPSGQGSGPNAPTNPVSKPDSTARPGTRQEAPLPLAPTDPTTARALSSPTKPPESTPAAQPLPVRFVNKVDPEYPPVAKRLGWEGTVTLLLELRADGSIGEVNVVASSNYPILDEAAKQAAKKWTHTPARRDGIAVTQWITQNIPFKLSDGGGGQPDGIRQTQERLKASGYYLGPIDGYFGPRTRDALRKYQETKGLIVTGELDKATKTALEAE